jgi:hypothetical protein
MDGIADLPPIEMPYSRFVRAEVAAATGPETAEVVDRWRARLAGMGVVPPLRLPCALRDTNREYLGDVMSTTVQPEVVGRLWTLCESIPATPFSVVLAAFGATLRRWGAGDDLGYYVPVGRRSSVELLRAVGLLATSTLVRQPIAGDPSFEDVVATTLDRVLEAFEDATIPWSEISRQIDPPVVGRHREEPGLWCDISPPPQTTIRLRDATVQPVRLPRQDMPSEMLGLTGQYGPDFLTLHLGFPRDVYPREAMAGLLRHLVAFLAAAADAPGDPLSVLWQRADAEVGPTPGLPRPS